MRMIQFKPEITYGTIFTLITFLAGGVGIYTSGKEQLARMDEQLKAEQASRITTDARHDKELEQIKGDLRSDLQDIRTELRAIREKLK